MNLIPNLIRQIRIPIGKQQYIHSTKLNNKQQNLRKRASVAVILRIEPKYNDININFKCTCNSRGNDHKEKCLESFINDLSNKKNKYLPLEILYLKRSDNGEVCFPGGKIEQGETDQEAAERETLEEVSIDLNSPDFALLGKLDDKFTFDKIGVHPFVYLQLCKKTPEIKLSINELVDYGWVTIDYLLNSNPNLPFKSSLLPPPPLSPSTNQNILKENTVQFTSVSNISTSKRLKKNIFLRFICNNITVPFLILPIVSRYQFKLWGLTLDITSDFLKKLVNYTPFPQQRTINNSIIFFFYRYPKTFTVSTILSLVLLIKLFT